MNEVEEIEVYKAKKTYLIKYRDILSNLQNMVHNLGNQRTAIHQDSVRTLAILTRELDFLEKRVADASNELIEYRIYMDSRYARRRECERTG